MARIFYGVLAVSLCFAGWTNVANCQESGQRTSKVSSDKAGAKIGAKQPRITEQQQMAIEELNSLIKESTAALSDSAAEKLYGLSDSVSQSSLLLWSYDPSSAGRSFKDLTDRLLDQYAKGRREKQDKERIAYTRRALKRAISLWSSRDASAGIAALQRLHKLEEDLNSGSNSISAGEEFELAKELLESAPNESARLAEHVIETYVPDRFPEYLYRLKSIDPSSASRVLNKSLTILASGQVYSFKQDLILQAYVLRESMIVHPVRGPVDFPGFESFQFPAGGVLSIDYSLDSTSSPDRIELASYLKASTSGLNRRLTGSTGVTGLDAATAYFLIQKLAAYSAVNQAAPPNSLMTLERVGATVAMSNGVSAENMTHLVTIAREVASKQFLSVLTGNMSTAAEKSTDPSLKARVKETEILAAIHKGDFEAAVEGIFGLDDSDSRDALSDNLYVNKINAAAKKQDWATVDESIEKIRNWNVKSYVLLECARTTFKVDKLRTSQYLDQARRIIENKLEVKERPQMLAALLTVYSQTNSNGLEEVLSITAVGLNRPFTEDDSSSTPKNAKGIIIGRYVGSDVSISLKGIAGGAIRYQFGGSNLESAFTGAGKRNWLASYSAAKQIQERSLRAKAVLGVCRAIL